MGSEHMTSRNKHQKRLKAIGISLAATPAMKELRDEALVLHESGLSDEEIIARLDERVDETGFGVRTFLGLSRKSWRRPAGATLIALATAKARKMGGRPFGAVVSEWLSGGNPGSWMSHYALQWARTGEPPALKESGVQWTGTLNIGPQDDPSPLVIAMAGPLSDPRQVAQDFLDRCRIAFPDENRANKAEPERDATRFKLFHDGHKDSEIVRAELEAEGALIACVDDQEIREEVQSRANAVNITRRRWDEHVTKLLGVLSPESD